MSTMKKRIPMFLLALAMMVAMALPTFAASYRPNAQFGYLLNINGSTGSAYQGRALNLMKTDTMGRDQNFIIGTRKGYTGYYMMVTANVNYAVNRSDNGGRAIIWPLSTGSADSRLADNSESVIRLYTSPPVSLLATGVPSISVAAAFLFGCASTNLPAQFQIPL